MSPTLLGCGEPLLTGIDLIGLGFRCTQHMGTDQSQHMVLTKG